MTRKHILYVCALTVEIDSALWNLAPLAQLDDLTEQCEDLLDALQQTADNWLKESKMDQRLTLKWNNE